MNVASLLNNNNDGISPTDRRPSSSSRQMSISHRADSVSSSTPGGSSQSPQRNGHSTSTPTSTSLDRPISSDGKIGKPPPERPPSTPAPAMKRKRENGEEKSKKKRRLQEPPLWAQVIPERAHLGITWDILKPYTQAQYKQQRQETTPKNIPAPRANGTPAVPVPQSNPFGMTYSNQLPADELTRTVADFLYNSIKPSMDLLSAANIEIEAKLGRIIQKDRDDDRVVLPVQTEAVMTPNPSGFRTMFQSSMTEEEHMHFNKQLNTTAIHTAGNSGGKTHERIQDIDSFWHLPRAEVLSGIPPELHQIVLGTSQGPVRLRISNVWDSKTGRGAEKACVIKRRVSNLDIYNPNWPFDYRISVNIEYNYTGTRNGLEPATEPNGAPVRDRAKNRLKYFYPVCDIDFTKVTSVPAGTVPNTNPKAEDFEHELEVELNSEKLYEQLKLLTVQPPVENRYEDLVRMLVDNVRLLTRSCRRA